MSEDPTATPDNGNSATLDPEPDTTVSPQDEAISQEQIDWEKRAKDHQAAFTRSQQVLSDEEALLAHIAEKFPHLIAEDADPDPDPDPDDLDDDEPTPDPRLEQIEGWVQKQQAKEALEQFDTDLKEIVGDTPVSDRVKQAILRETLENGGTFDALKSVAEGWLEEEGLKPAKARQRVPATPKGGTKPTPESWDDLSGRALDDAMIARLQAEQQ